MGDTRLLILLPGVELFGQERALIAVAIALRESGVACHFLVHKGWGAKIAAHVESLGFEHTELPLGTIWSKSLFRAEPSQILGNMRAMFMTPIALYRCVKKFRATHLLTGNVTFTGYLLPALFWLDIFVIFRHGDDASTNYVFHRVLNNMIFNRADVHVAN